ncbi:MAG: DUF3313 domain-containing protein [Planctomycetota bacterium]|jgi:hypothetical protein
MKKTSVLMMLAIGLMAVQCGCGPKAPKTVGFLSDYSRLEADSSSSLRYVNEQALVEYSAFIVDRVAVHFHSGADAVEERTKGKLTQQNIDDLTNYFHSAIVKALTDGGYKVVYRPGQKVARIRLAITDIEKTNVVLAAIPHTHLAGVGIGGASMEVEAVDSVTGEQIGAVVESKEGSRIPFTGLSDWGGAKGAMDEWAERLVKRLDAVHKR